MFFSFIAKVIPLKNRENQTSYHYCTFVAHLADENQSHLLLIPYRFHIIFEPARLRIACRQVRLSVCRQAGTPADRSAGKQDGRQVGARAGLQASVRMPICFCLLHHSFVALLLR